MTVTFLVVQWLRLHVPNAGGTGSIPGQGTRPHMLQQLKIPHATTRARWDGMLTSLSLQPPCAEGANE